MPEDILTQLYDKWRESVNAPERELKARGVDPQAAESATKVNFYVVAPTEPIPTPDGKPKEDKPE